MVEVYVLCEGQTERDFCNRVLASALVVRGIRLVGPLGGKPHRHRSDGGIRRWASVRPEILQWARSHPRASVAVLVDYYAMPNCWPGRGDASALPCGERGTHVEDALVADLRAELGDRFVPCVQLHEFEALLFVNPAITALSIEVASQLERPQLEQELQAIKTSFSDDVERINDCFETAPSRRIQRLVRGYKKVVWGLTAAEDVTLPVLRDGCPWLSRWLDRLEGLAT